MIRRLSVIPVVAALGMLLACGSPTGPDIPDPGLPDPKDDDDQSMVLGAPTQYV